MSRAPDPPDDERALFEAALAELERGGKRRMLLEKAGVPEERRRRSPQAPARAPARHAPPRLSRRLRAGEEVARRLDLHGLDRAAALEAVARFVRDTPAGDLALIIHGKGRGILARAVCEVLDRTTRVAEHLEAPARLGGAGARVVRLRSRRPA